MDFQSLPRRELQELCKSNGIRANTTNAAMVEALRLLPSVSTSPADKAGEIGSKAPPPPPQPMSEMKEQAHEALLPRGRRTRTQTRKAVAAGNTEEDDVHVPDQAALTLQGSQRTAAPAEAVGEEQEKEHGCPLPRGRRARGKTRKAGARKAAAAAAAAAEEEEEEVVPAPHTLPGNKRTVAEEPAAPVDAEVVAVGMKPRRSTRSKVKFAVDQKEEDVQAEAAARKEQKDKSCNDSEEHPVVIVVEEGVTKLQEGQNVTEDLQKDQGTAQEVTMAKKKTRRTTRSKGVAAARKGQNADSSDTTIKPEVDPKDDEVVIVVEEGVTKLQEGQNVTEDLQEDQRKAEEVAMAKNKTRRTTKSKAARKVLISECAADSSDTTIKPEVDPKDDEVVPEVKEATKPHEGKNVTRRATVYKAQEEVQTSQVTAAPEAMAAVEEEEVTKAKRRRRPARSKPRVAARKGQKDDSSDAVNGSTVSDNPKEEHVVEVIEEGTTKPNEEEQEKISNLRPFASLPKLEDSPILGVVSKSNATDASGKAQTADEEAIKEDGFTFTGEPDLSNLFVSTLDRFAKPMYESTVEEEKKGNECWWMLL